ncbi:hypothetical protein O6H91_20G007700 [Diphasiastrum complanatum]|nr:hypothetical protein O6H91_20G007700 [Diphasiastrum complanatum]
MKAGPCGDTFARWEKCVEQGEKEEGGDIVTKCWPVTQLLKTCMEANAEYYGVVIEAEKAIMEKEADHKNEQTVVAVESDNSTNNDEGVVSEGTATAQSE